MKTILDKKVTYYFVTGGQFTLRAWEADKLNDTADDIKRKIDTQMHLHMETEPTDPIVIARECYVLGWCKGKAEGIMEAIEQFGYKDLYNQEEEKRRKKRQERINRWAIHMAIPDGRPEVLKYLDIMERGFARCKECGYMSKDKDDADRHFEEHEQRKNNESIDH
jgi:hypothetical protein